MSNYNKRKTTRILTHEDIIDCRKKLSGVMIAPFQESNAKGIGYNLSPSEMVYSVDKKGLLSIRSKGNERYVIVKPGDTVLLLSYEYVRVDSNYAGTFHARVRNLANGLGSISTTLDPNWRGMLLFALNNPTKRKIKLVLSVKNDGREEPRDLVTLVLWKSNCHDSDDAQKEFLKLDNPPMRSDIWREQLEESNPITKRRDYIRFQNVIDGLMKFKANRTDRINTIEEIERLLTEFKKVTIIEFSDIEAQKILLTIKSTIPPNRLECNEYGELEEKILEVEKELTKCIAQKKADDKLKKTIELFGKECEYQRLCEEVRQIHEFIHNNTEQRRFKSIIGDILEDFFWPAIPGIFSTVLLIYIFFFYLKPEETEFINDIFICLIPVFTTIILEFCRRYIFKDNKS